MLDDIFEGLARGLFGAAADRHNGATRSGRNHGHQPGLIDRLCDELDWSVDERDGNMVKLHFNDELVGRRKLVIRHDGDYLASFAVVSYAVLHRNDVPPGVVSHLLARNAELAFGHWHVTMTDEGNAVFVLQYYALAQALTAPLLKHIASQMIPEVSGFDARMKQAGLLRLQ